MAALVLRMAAAASVAMASMAMAAQWMTAKQVAVLQAAVLQAAVQAVLQAAVLQRTAWWESLAVVAALGAVRHTAKAVAVWVAKAKAVHAET
jgi:hypothetical protein